MVVDGKINFVDFVDSLATPKYCNKVTDLINYYKKNPYSFISDYINPDVFKCCYIGKVIKNIIEDDCECKFTIHKE